MINSKEVIRDIIDRSLFVSCEEKEIAYFLLDRCDYIESVYSDEVLSGINRSTYKIYFVCREGAIAWKKDSGISTDSYHILISVLFGFIREADKEKDEIKERIQGCLNKYESVYIR
jgi:hypothetical protein